MPAEALFCALRPNGTAVWLPLEVLRAVGAKRRTRMTQEQFDSPVIQEIIEARARAERAPKAK